jgi:hypothetical protein
MKNDWRTLLRVGAIVFIVMLAIDVPQWLGAPLLALVTAPIAMVAASFTLGRGLIR